MEKNILVIRLSSLGDIILTFPVLKNIKKNIPNSKIYYLVKKKYADILKANPDVDEVVLFEGLLKTLQKLKKIDFDYIFDLHSNIRSFILRKFIKAKFKTRYKKHSFLRYLFVRFKYISPKLERHVVEKYLQTLTDVGLQIFTRDVKIDFFSLKKEGISYRPQKIIIVQTAFLGDLLLTLPIVEKIKKAYPYVRIGFVVRDKNSDVIKTIEGIDLIYEDKKTKEKLKSFFRLLKAIKSERFDIAIIPHRSLRSALLCYLAKIPIRIGFDIKPISIFYTEKVPFNWSIHDAERNMMLIRSIVKETYVSFPKILLKNDNLNIPQPFIVVNPSSIWNTKRWPDYKFVKLITRILENYDIKVVLIGGIDEKNYVDKIEQKLPKNLVINICGKTSLIELIETIKKAKLLITNDSGPMHIAASVGTPVVAIFGPTTKELGFFPYSKDSLVVEENLRCRPCRLHGSNKCPHKHFLCMKLVSVDDVFECVKKFIEYRL